jgi:hypothetical protein
LFLRKVVLLNTSLIFYKEIYMAIKNTTITIEDTPVNTTYQDVTGTTTGAGTGAKFDVVKNNGAYNVTLDTATGSFGTGYVAGDTITIAGTSLGGIAPTNNLIVTVGTVGANGAIATFGAVGAGRKGDGNIDVVVKIEGTALDIETYNMNGKSTDFTLTYDAINKDIIATSALATNVKFVLDDVERVAFTDKRLAFDTVGTDLGKIIALMAAAIGENDITPAYIGAGMYLRENLGWTVKEIAAKILTSTEYLTDAGGTSNTVFAKHVWQNVFGREGTYDEIASVIETIEKHGYSQADVLMVAANRPELLAQIDLVGLQTTGVEYVPFGG